MVELKYGEKIILSAFNPEQHQFIEAEKGYLELLTVEKPRGRFVHIVHEACSSTKTGCFVECDSLYQAERIFNIASGYDSAGEWFNFVKSVVDKRVIYKCPRQPWFYSDNVKIFEDTYTPS